MDRWNHEMPCVPACLLRRGGGDAGGGDGVAAAFDDAVGDFGEVLFQNQAERAPAAVIGRGHEMHAVGMVREVVTFFERPARGIIPDCTRPRRGRRAS